MVDVDGGSSSGGCSTSDRHKILLVLPLKLSPYAAAFVERAAPQALTVVVLADVVVAYDVFE